MRIAVIFVTLVLTFSAQGFARAAFVAVPAEGEVTYNFDWTTCTLIEALEGLYDQFKVPTFAAILDSGTVKQKPSPNPFRTLPNCVPSALAGSWIRDSVHFGEVTVFYPYQLHSLRTVRQAMAASLAASLTSRQLDKLGKDGGVPFDELSEKQQDIAYYLASAESYDGRQFPEPAMSKYLHKSRLIVALHPNIRYDYATGNGSGSCGVNLDHEASARLWRQWAPGQLDVGKAAAKAATSPGEDAPGGAEMCELCGVYTLDELLGYIRASTDIPVTCVSNASTERIAAHCRISAAGLARACAAAMGMQWRRVGGSWLLSKGRVAETLKNYEPGSVQKYVDAANAAKPALRDMLKSGKLVYVADAEFQNPDLFDSITSGDPVDWERLTAEQQSYIQRWLDTTSEAYKDHHDIPTDHSALKMSWQPSVRFYLAADNAILYSEWISTR